MTFCEFKGPKGNRVNRENGKLRKQPAWDDGRTTGDEARNASLRSLAGRRQGSVGRMMQMMSGTNFATGACGPPNPKARAVRSFVGRRGKNYGVKFSAPEFRPAPRSALHSNRFAPAIDPTGRHSIGLRDRGERFGRSEGGIGSAQFAA